MHDIPIPISENAPITSQLGDIPFDLTNARCCEPLIDLREAGVGGESFYARTDGKNFPYCTPIPGAITQLLARESVVLMLRAADQRLRPLGLRVFVLDAYRPLAVQVGLWNFFHRRVSAAAPGMTENELDARVPMFVSDPRQFDETKPRTWPVHSTGGAVDVMLRRLDGEVLDFGARFDDFSELAHTDYYERLLRAGRISSDDPRLIHRRYLYWSMFGVGFTNYPYEYWHYDFGDQMYIASLHRLRIRNPRAAWYRYVPWTTGRLEEGRVAKAPKKRRKGKPVSSSAVD